MDFTSTDFFNLFPAFENKVAPEVVDLWIAEACQYVEPTIWGDKATLGVGLMTAHLLVYLGAADMKINNASGAVKREKVGDLEVEYETSSGRSTDADALDSTPYGRQFKSLRRTVAKGPLVVGCNTI